MPKATVSSLEVEVWSSAEQALASLDKLEDKLNKVGSVLDVISEKAKTIKELGAIAEGFKGIASAAKEIEKLAKSADRAKKSAKSLDDVFEEFADVGTNWNPGEKLGLKELSDLSDAYTKKIESAYDRLDKAQALGFKPGSTTIARIVYDIQNYQNRLESISERIDEIQTRNNERMADLTITGIGHDDAEDIEEVADAMHDLDDAVVSTGQAFAGAAPLYENVEAEVEALMGGIESLDDVFDRFGAAGADWKPAEGLGLKDLERMARSAERQIENLYAKIEKYQAFGITPNDRKMQNAVYDLSVMLNHYDAIKEAIAGASKAQNEFTEGTRKVGSAAPKLKAIAEGFKKVFSALGLGKTHTSKLFGRRGFGGFLSLMVIRRALTSLIRALTGGIKEGSDNLAQYSAEYNNSISRMVSGLNYLKNAWAAAFAPIVNVVAPYVETFINLLASALNAIGRFMAALTGKGFAVQAKSVWTDYAASLDKAGSSAGGAGSKMDDLKKTIMSFDEIHALTDPNSSGGGGGGGSGAGGLNPSDMFETVDLAGDSLAEFASQLREKILAGDWTGVGEAIAEKMNKAIDKLNGSSWAANLAERLNHFIEAYNGWADKFDWKGLGTGLGKSVNDFFLTFNWNGAAAGVAKTLNGLLTTFINFAKTVNWYEIGKKIVEAIGTFFSNLNWNTIGQALRTAFESLIEFCNGVLDAVHVDEIALYAARAIINGLTGFFDGNNPEFLAAITKCVKNMILTAWQVMTPWLALLNGWLKDTFGIDILGGISKKFDEWIEEAFPEAQDKVHGGAGGVLDDLDKQVNKEYGKTSDAAVKKTGQTVDESKKKWNPFAGWFKTNVNSPISGHASNLNTNITTAFATAAANATSKFSGISSWFDTNVKVPISSVFSSLGTSISNAFASAKTNLTSGWGNVSGWFETHVSVPIRNLFGTFKSIGASAAENLRAGLKSITNMPTFHFSWNTEKKIVSLFGHQIVASVPWPKISFYAHGGFPDADLFAANERGNPEMVGRIGNRTAVANNNQITEALKNAMIEGLMQYGMAMSANDNGQPYQINLVVKTMNDEVLARAVERGNARRNARMYPAGAVR